MNTLRYARNKDADGLIKLIDTCFREYPNCILDVDNEMTELKNIYSTCDSNKALLKILIIRINVTW